MINPFLLPLVFQYFALIFAFSFGFLSYIFLIYKKKVSPNISTWVVWSLAPMISFFVSLLSGAVWSDLAVIFIAGFGPLLVVFTALIYKQYYLKSKILDLVCFILAVSGLILYYLTKDILLAQSILIVVDLVATFPMLSKIWFSADENEPIAPFIVYFVTYLISLFTQPVFTIASSMFLAYLVLQTAMIAVSIILKNIKLKAKNR